MPSIFDTVHDAGGRTALLYSELRLDVAARAWDATNGAVDPAVTDSSANNGVDDGTNKITTVSVSPDDNHVVAALRNLLTGNRPDLAFAQLSSLAKVGHKAGWMSPAYLTAVARVDALVGQILTAVKADPELADSTMVVVTADSAGSGTKRTAITDPANYTVPLIVWGPGITPGDLYSADSTLTDPGTARPSYVGAQPIRIGVIANLIASALGLPAVPGSEFDPTQDLRPWATAG